MTDPPGSTNLLPHAPLAGDVGGPFFDLGGPVGRLAALAQDDTVSERREDKDMKIGILAVQGDYEAHGRMLERLGVEYALVRTPEEMAGLSGLILPGGESTTHWKVLNEEGLRGALEKFAAEGGAFFGTCAGAILLAREVRHPAQGSLGIMDMVVERNGYGRQVASDVGFGASKLKEEPLEMVFIRAPIIVAVGPGVEVLAEFEGRPVLVQQGRAMAATFHPELTTDSTVHERFLRMLRRD
jgi:pyridoxal 5'-phosphate synthase pdxT subunit